MYQEMRAYKKIQPLQSFHHWMYTSFKTGWSYPTIKTIYCMIRSGSILKRRSSLSLLTSSSRAVSLCNALCRSVMVISGLPFSFTIMSPSLIPPLETNKGTKRWSISSKWLIFSVTGDMVCWKKVTGPAWVSWWFIHLHWLLQSYINHLFNPL